MACGCASLMFFGRWWSRRGARGARHWSAEGATGGARVSAGGARWHTVESQRSADNFTVSHPYVQLYTYVYTCTRSQNCERSHRHSLYSTKIRKKSQRAWTFFLLRSQSFSELLANQRRDRGEASLRSTDRRGMSLAVSPVKLID